MTDKDLFNGSAVDVGRYEISSPYMKQETMARIIIKQFEAIFELDPDHKNTKLEFASEKLARLIMDEVKYNSDHYIEILRRQDSYSKFLETYDE